jgi:hypothetical protein
MSLSRPKLQLDEQAFQGLLAAAFTIQEHADLLKHITEARPDKPNSKVVPETKAQAPRLCPRCAAPLKEGESHGVQCGSDQLRPGERMQRKYASLWEMSQERLIQPKQESVLELASSGSSAPPENADRPLEPQRVEWGEDPIEVQHEDTTSALAMTDASSPKANSSDAGLRDTLLALRQQLNLHRADLYLGLAVVVAVIALLWPAPAAPQKPRLEPWQRVLVKLGIAEAPPATIHPRGDPNLQVWVDPHTALYYCPGDEQYGKTPDGRLSSQRDAQLDRFQPANRAACN